MPSPADSDSGRDPGTILSSFLDDQQHGELQPLPHYLARFADRTTLVRSEYTALFGMDDAASPTLPGTTLGPYRLDQQLGRGGQAEVFAAVDTRTSARVAIKRLSATNSQDPTRRQRLADEIALAGRFDHPGLCRVLAHDLAHEQPYAVLELIAGRTLFTELHALPCRTAERAAARAAPRGRSGRWPWADYLVRLALAVQVLHAADVVHLDLKPANLMVTPDGAPRVLDFGLARDLRRERAPGAGAEGTRDYMAPEQWTRPESVDCRADVFALGSLAIECCTGERPFAATGPRQRQRAIEAGWSPPPGVRVPTGWHQVLARAVAARPETRQANAAQLAAELQLGLGADGGTG